MRSRTKLGKQSRARSLTFTWTMLGIYRASLRMHGGKIVAKRSYPLPKVYGRLETGPVVLLTTAHKGRMNVMSQSWHTMMAFEPPLVGCIVNGNSTGRKTDKFRAFDLTPLPASLVTAPADRRMLRQPRMQRRRHAHGQPLQLLRAGSGQGLDRPNHPRTAHPPPSREGSVHDRGGNDQVAVANEIGRTEPYSHGDSLRSHHG
jgi:hypothetical protein